MTELTDHRSRPRVVMTGLGLVTPIGVGVASTWDSVLAGRSGIGPITQFDATDFKTHFAGEATGFDASEWLDKKAQRRNDRFIQLAIGASQMAMDDSGLAITEANADRVAVIVGAGLGGLSTLESHAKILQEKGPSKISPFFIPGLIVNLAAGQISIRFGARGPNWSPVSACATSGHAIGEAVETIRRGAADAAIAGGSEATITPLGIGGFNAMKALSTRNDAPEAASRPWDVDRDGFVMGEGAGVVVLERLDHARARGAEIIAEVAGYGATGDAGHITAPDGKGAQRCMVAALADAAMGPESVAYINAHGTSTPVGDRQEIDAVKTIFAEHAQTVMMSSTKSMHGHLLGAAGGVEAIITALAMRHGIAPPTINLDTPDVGCDIDLVPHEPKERAIPVAMSNSFGFGGTNTTLVLKRI